MDFGRYKRTNVFAYALNHHNCLQIDCVTSLWSERHNVSVAGSPSSTQPASPLSNEAKVLRKQSAPLTENHELRSAAKYQSE